MVKSSNRSSGATHSSRTNAALVGRQVQQFYDLGQRVREVDSTVQKLGKGLRNWGVYEQFAKGHSRNQVEKARMFASLYTREDLNELLALGTKGGMPLGRRHVIYLLSIKNRRTRLSLQKHASEEAWSTRRLAIEIRQRQGKKSQGGRLPMLPVTMTEALIQLDDMSSHWIRWHKVLSEPANAENDAVPWNQLPEGIRKRVQGELVPLLEKLRGQIKRTQNSRKRRKARKKAGVGAGQRQHKEVVAEL